jgi:hypothetical protein
MRARPFLDSRALRPILWPPCDLGPQPSELVGQTFHCPHRLGAPALVHHAVRQEIAQLVEERPAVVERSDGILLQQHTLNQGHAVGLEVGEPLALLRRRRALADRVGRLLEHGGEASRAVAHDDPQRAERQPAVRDLVVELGFRLRGRTA